MGMRRLNRHHVWFASCAVALTSACGDSMTVTDGGTGTGTSSASTGTTAGPGTTPTSTAGLTDGTGSGSVSDSNTGSTTAVNPTTGPTSGPTSETSTTNTSNTSTDGTTAGSDPGTTGDGSTSTTGEGSSSGTTNDTGIMPGACVGPHNYTLNAHFDKGLLNNVNHDAPNGDQLQITIDGVSLPKPYMFLAHTYDGLMLKLDTATGKQLARYDSTLLKDCPTCPVNKASWYPSRVIVDFDGDVYVANRAFGVQGALTKIAGSIGSCIDRNNNGEIETSNDKNGDGIINHTDPAEFFGQNDECILWSLPVAEPNALLRALTLDGKGNAYVGTYNTLKGYKIDVTQTPPVITKTFNVPSTAYGFVVRGDYLYQSALGQPVGRIDLNNFSVTTMNAPGNYGIAVDQNGIAWYGGSGLQRCDFTMGGTCQNKGGGGMSGVAVDAEGQVWGCSGNTVYKFANDGTQLGTATAAGAYGISIGHDGDPRVVAYNAAYKIESGKVGMPPGPVTTYNTGYFGGGQPFNYTYSDFTGFGALNVTVRKGEWTVVHDGVDDNSLWQKVAWNLEKEGKVIPGTKITFQVRAAVLKADLPLKPWTSVTGFDIDGYVEGRFLEVRARLIIEDENLDESPVLSDVCVLREGEGGP